MGDATGCSTDESGRSLSNFMLDDESLQQLLQTSGSQPFSGIEQGPPQYTPAGGSPGLLPSPLPNQLPAMGYESNMQPGPQQDVSMYSSDLAPHSALPFIQDLLEPEYLIGRDGTPNTGEIEKAKESPKEFGFTTNFKDEGECPKSTPETYCQSKGMLLVQPSDVQKTETARKLVLFTSKEIPAGWRVRIVLLSNNKDEVHNPIKSCRNHEIPWIGNSALEHYIVPTKEYMKSCVYHHGHPVLLVPEEYFQKRRGEEGYSYIGKFFFPCNTSHLKPKLKSVKLVAGLEVPTYQGWYHCAGLTTVDVRVCGSPGRDKMATTDRKTGKGKQEAEDVCSSDGDEPPTRKKKKMATDTSEAMGSSSGVSSTGPPAPEGGVSSGGEHTGATNLLHEMQMQLEADRKETEKIFLEKMEKILLEERERYREMRAEEREKDKLMFEEVLRKWLTEERGACFHGKQPPAF